MRFILSIFSLMSLGLGCWYTWENMPLVREFLLTHIPLNSTGFQTLEIRYSAEEIMQSHKDELLKGQGYHFLEPKILYYPYVLMDVKYSKDKISTQEGILLWGLNDGEMILESSTWEKTHGFEDCLLAKADKNDFKIIQMLVENGGAVDREKIYQKFKVDHDILDDWIDSCREKKLIVISGNKFRLHLQNPRLEMHPTTLFSQAIVTQTTKHCDQIKGIYSASQIKKFAQIVFGNDFAVRKVEEVFLPVYRLAIQNPDGSVFTTYWNALNGKKLHSSI